MRPKWQWNESFSSKKKEICLCFFFFIKTRWIKILRCYTCVYIVYGMCVCVCVSMSRFMFFVILIWSDVTTLVTALLKSLKMFHLIGVRIISPIVDLPYILSLLFILSTAFNAMPFVVVCVCVCLCFFFSRQRRAVTDCEWNVQSYWTHLSKNLDLMHA